MKLVADENIEDDLIAWLRAYGEDVLAVKESMRSAADDEILAVANAQNRIILTKDLDFGELVFRDRLLATGIVLLRLEGSATIQRISIVTRQWPEIARNSTGNFLVVMQDRIRVRPISKPSEI